MEKKEPKKRFLAAQHIVSSTLCPPAVRTVILVLHIDRKDLSCFQDILPVLAIEARVSETYRKTTYNSEEFTASDLPRKELLDRGYRISGRCVDHYAVYVDEYCLNTTQSNPHASNGMSRLVCCPWPAEEDEKHFKPIFDEMEKELKERVEDGTISV